ncbi:hypothetical protein A2U01_0054998, partial [Trifolium medium]|nr:hypothetical protein [Trifolium medium]
MLFCSFDPMVETVAMFRMTVQVKCFDEFGGEHDFVDEGTECYVTQGHCRSNGIIVEVES